MTNYFHDKLNGYIKATYLDLSPKQKKYYTFCILRDVKDRFNCGMTEIIQRYMEQSDQTSKISKIHYTNSYNEAVLLNNHNLSDYINKSPDVHLRKQTDFLKGIRIDEYVNMSQLKNNSKLDHNRKSDNLIRNNIKFNVNININSDTIYKVYNDDVQLLKKCKNLEETKIIKKLLLK
jgi:hypothetical protein